MLTLIVYVFSLGYLLIALEGVTRINKTAVALVMCVTCWALFAAGYLPLYGSEGFHQATCQHLGNAGSTVFFLLGAMGVVDIIAQKDGFRPVVRLLYTRHRRTLVWRVGVVTFLLSAVLDNLTTCLIMITLLRSLVASRRERLPFVALTVIAANAGGAFSPIGDVTSIMLWDGGYVTAPSIVRHTILPSAMACLVPMCLISWKVGGRPLNEPSLVSYAPERGLGYFLAGVGGLCAVPVFHQLTGLPPFLGMLGLLGVMLAVGRVTPRLDLTTLLFFLGILMAVAVLAETGLLAHVGLWLNYYIGSSQSMAAIIGLVSAFIDNVPLVASAMRMYGIDPAGGAYGVDGSFWLQLAYSAGIGGSLLAVGSAAGVAAMGMEGMTFGWYLRHITPIAFLGFAAGFATLCLMGC